MKLELLALLFGGAVLVLAVCAKPVEGMLSEVRRKRRTARRRRREAAENLQAAAARQARVDRSQP